MLFTRLAALCLLAAAGQAAAQVPLVPTAAPAPSSAGPMDASAVVRGIQAFYLQSQDMKAGFTQTYTYKVYGRSQLSNGTVFFKKPGMMRWDYKAPVPKVFVADQATLWVYEPQENQAFKRPIRSAQLPIALTFMSGKGKLEDEFSALLIPTTRAGTYLVELTPKKSEADYKSLRLVVDDKTFAVLESTVVDPVGNTNHLVFSDVTTNAGLPDAGFTFRPPAGVRIIEEPNAQEKTP